MSNPNTVTVYSPSNEPFEMSRINARDLCSHAGWSMKPLDGYTPPKPIEADTQIEEAADAADNAGSVEDAETNEGEGAETNEGEGKGEDAGEEDDALVIRKEETDFADLETRDDVVAYLAEAFPEFKPHHLAKREGLVAKAIELAAK
jgi:hypothetical protein